MIFDKDSDFLSIIPCVRICVVLVIVAAAFSKDCLYMTFMLSCVAVLSSFIWRCHCCEVLPKIRYILSSLFCLVYVGLFPAHFVLLRHIADNQNIIENFANLFQGTLLESGALCCYLASKSIFVNDIFAYYIGKLMGKNKLTSFISPNKTVEGSVGGILAGGCFFSLVAYFTGKYFGLDLVSNLNAFGWGLFIAFGFILNILGQVGDLVESLIKRVVGVKDSGYIIEGQGGVLDRFDSHLFTIPIAYYFFECLFRVL